MNASLVMIVTKMQVAQMTTDHTSAPVSMASQEVARIVLILMSVTKHHAIQMQLVLIWRAHLHVHVYLDSLGMAPCAIHCVHSRRVNRIRTV